MNPHQPTIHNPNSQARDEQRREEAKKEELERKRIEDEILDFDAHGFYDDLSSWVAKPIPAPRNIDHISLVKKQPVVYQPIPIPRAEFRTLYSLSKRSAELLVLLKAAEQKGFDCPYVHQTHKETLEASIEKCKALQQAVDLFLNSSGMIAKLMYLLHRSYVNALEREIEKLSARLEAIFLMCRHAEFTQDLVRLRRAVTYRTGYVLGPDSQIDATGPRKGTFLKKK